MRITIDVYKSKYAFDYNSLSTILAGEKEPK